MKETRFKNTELGPIPEDWEIEEIGKLGKILTTSCSPFLYPDAFFNEYSMPAYDNGQIVDRVKGREINSNRYILHGKMLLINKLNVRQKRIWAIDVCDNESVCSTEFLPFQSNQMPIELLRHILLQDKIVQEWSDNSTGTSNSQKRISPKYLKEYKILVPGNPPEQEKIAEALSDVDALIAELGELIEKKRLVKQGAMQQLLTAKRRLPGFSKPWVEHRLGDIGVFSKGKGISKAETTSDGLPCIRYGEIYTTHHDYIKSFVSYISPQTAIDSVRLQKGQILFTASGETKEDIGKAVAFNLDKEAYAGGDIIIFTPSIPCDAVFIGYAMNTPDINIQKSALGQGDAVVHIGASSLATIAISIPEIDEQRAIAEVLTDMDNEIAELEAKREKYRAIKEGMMQQLLTGRIRLIDPTASTDSATSVASSNPAGVSPHAPVITYEPTTAYPHSLAAEP